MIGRLRKRAVTQIAGKRLKSMARSIVEGAGGAGIENAPSLASLPGNWYSADVLVGESQIRAKRQEVPGQSDRKCQGKATGNHIR
ncbi:MAG: hypothetical protein CMM07_27580 [Rhodopirellula sp.]|nr:hypothetical protein [Rhodopirellula sp.]